MLRYFDHVLALELSLELLLKLLLELLLQRLQVGKAAWSDPMIITAHGLEKTDRGSQGWPDEGSQC